MSEPADGLFGRKLVRAEFALYASVRLRQARGPDATLSSCPWLAFTEAS
ncbi:MAG: hypothetical protein ACI9MC_004060 [Kiritimatiellia bacterium]|jgi:hypothetical protein